MVHQKLNVNIVPPLSLDRVTMRMRPHRRRRPLSATGPSLVTVDDDGADIVLVLMLLLVLRSHRNGPLGIGFICEYLAARIRLGADICVRVEQ